MFAVGNFGESTNKTVGKKYFGEMTQCSKNGKSAKSLNKFLRKTGSNLNDTK